MAYTDGHRRVRAVALGHNGVLVLLSRTRVRINILLMLMLMLMLMRWIAGAASPN